VTSARTRHAGAGGLRADAWRGEPELTRRIVEAEAAGASQEARDQLARVRRFAKQRGKLIFQAGLAGVLELSDPPAGSGATGRLRFVHLSAF
jgi:hypothetical protein